MLLLNEWMNDMYAHVCVCVCVHARAQIHFEKTQLFT